MYSLQTTWGYNLRVMKLQTGQAPPAAGTNASNTEDRPGTPQGSGSRLLCKVACISQLNELFPVADYQQTQLFCFLKDYLFI